MYVLMLSSPNYSRLETFLHTNKEISLQGVERMVVTVMRVLTLMFQIWMMRQCSGQMHFLQMS